MQDLLYIGVTVLFFVLAAALARLRQLVGSFDLRIGL